MGWEYQTTLARESVSSHRYSLRNVEPSAADSKYTLASEWDEVTSRQVACSEGFLLVKVLGGRREVGERTCSEATCTPSAG